MLERKAIGFFEKGMFTIFTHVSRHRISTSKHIAIDL